MLCIIRKILIVFALIAIINEARCKRDTRKFRLSRVFENINEKKSKNYRNELENGINQATDMDCVNNFFNLPKNNKMIVTQLEELIFIIAAGMKCSNEDKVFEKLLDEFIFKGLRKRLNCLKWVLQKFEPESKLIENFKINESDINECSIKFSTDGIVKLQEELEQTLGPLGVYSCGAVTGADDYVKFLTKGAIIRYDDISEELKEIEMKELKEYFKDISISTVSCNIKRFENDSQASQINDTLHYHFNKYMKQIDLNNSKQNQNDDLKAIESDIDHDCVKEKLNLPKNGNKSILKIEATILLAAAKSKCIKSDLLEFSELFLNFTVPEYYKSEENVACAKYKLQQLEPTSKLVENVINNQTYEELCENYGMDIHPFDIYQWDYEKSVGQMNETTCGVLTYEIVDVIEFKTYLLANEMNEELKKSEIQELFAVATEKLSKLADCVLGHVVN